MSPDKKISVLMITGVYLPEINGAVFQCSQLINNLRKFINYSILTGTSNDLTYGSDHTDDVLVTRVFMPKKQKLKFIFGAAWFYIQLIRELRKVDLVHVHGFSNRNAIVIIISLIFNRKVILKMTSFGHDDPMTIKSCSLIKWKIFSYCHAYIGLSPAFLRSFKKTELLEYKYSFIPNGVDLNRYFQVTQNEKNVLRVKYGYSAQDKIIIFVGHFSTEKRPMYLYRAWVKLCELNICIKLIFIGHTRNNFEVDESIVKSIRKDAFQRGLLPLVNFVEETLYVDEYMKIADTFILPSIREGLPNVLLEAMACALPCIVSELPGVTDWLIDDGVNGVLFRSDDPDVLAAKIGFLFSEHGLRQKMGSAARHLIESNFASELTAQKMLDLYIKTMN